MSHKTLDTLVMMANQIARNMMIQGEERALPQISEHIRLYWDPRMRKAIDAHLDAGGEGLDDLARRALTALRDERAAS
ncbi:formate dehydrogenase subunit delta [Methylobrevis albus]|uniref:Formate dehydrogenase subunit delta n=1 Tax=Methylobrevis albus TaxID=2793297 RepID=A0A931MZM4_9HYPH|nr:formate dehydrogenase subunit delta [Methylobrevis albus]MBH0238239.1 formate dehydrogenase subunit delta [Methylobrevis albus]